MTAHALIPLLAFMALLLDLALLGLSVSGHFPRAPATDEVKAIDIYGSIAVAVLSCGVGIVAAARLLPWYALVIGGGLSILCAPLLLQKFGDRFVDGRGALMAFSAIGLLLTMGLVFLGGGPAL